MTTLPLSIRSISIKRLNDFRSISPAQTRLRLRVCCFQDDRSTSYLDDLIAQGIGLTVAQAKFNRFQKMHQYDLELTGTIDQLQTGLHILELQEVSIYGKPNPDGDSWHC